MSEKLTLGLDIGGTKMAFAVVDAAGNIREETTIPTLADNPYDVTVRRIADHLNHYLERYPHIIGIGAGVPGPIDTEAGIAIHAVNLGWQKRPIKADVLAHLKRELPVYIENDVNVGAIGEKLYGAGKTASNFVYISIGTGLRGAVLWGDKMLRGTNACEMEVGHLSLDPENGLLCGCGQRGCVEMVISGKGFVATAQANHAKFPQTQVKADAITTRDIISLAHAGDALATFVIDEAAQALGMVCAWCTMIFNPPLIILGGGLTHAAYDLLKAKTLATMQAHCLRQSFEAVTVTQSELTNAALGASALVWYFGGDDKK